MNSSNSRYENEIRCEMCDMLVGYAPYSRDEYQCISCNQEKCKHKFLKLPGKLISKCKFCKKYKEHV